MLPNRRVMLPRKNDDFTAEIALLTYPAFFSTGWQHWLTQCFMRLPALLYYSYNTIY
jgi:hypothetical protein